MQVLTGFRSTAVSGDGFRPGTLPHAVDHDLCRRQDGYGQKDAGYAGQDKDLLYIDKTMMVLGDAKKVVEDMVKAVE